MSSYYELKFKYKCLQQSVTEDIDKLMQSFHIAYSIRIHMNQTGTLLILDTQYSDNGHYKAVATNKAGRVEAVANLHIHFRKHCN